MRLTLSELATLVGGTLDAGSDPALIITGFSSVGEAEPGDVTFFGNPKYLASVRKCRASAVLVPLDFAEAVPPVPIRVENPTLAFSRLVTRFGPEPVAYPPGVHPTAVVSSGVVLGEGTSIQPHAVIEDGAQIGARTVIGAFCFVGREAQIGEDCLLHPRVTVGERCLVGHRVVIQSGAVLGSDGFGFESVQGRHVKIPQIGIVQVDDDVEIGANSTIDRARFGRTWIGRGTKIDNLVQIAHNVVIGEHCIIVAQVGISGSTRLGNYVTLAGQVGLVGHIEIGDQAVVGATAGVNKSLPPKGMYLGNPCLPAAQYRKQVAYWHRLGRLFERVKQLEEKAGEPPKS